MYYEKVTDAIETVASLAEEIWIEHYKKIIPEDTIRMMVKNHQSSDAIAKKIADGYEYFLIFDPSPVGYFAVKETEKGLYLDKAYLKKSSRKKGYFKKIISDLSSKGFPRIYLSVNSENESSIAVYTACGFKICGESKNDFGGGAVFKDYIMEKLFKNDIAYK